MAATQTLVVLGIVTAVGIGFTGFGYELAGRLVSWVGALAGVAAGGAAGWFAAPVLGSGGIGAQLGFAAAGVLIGAIVGRLLFPVATRLAAVTAGFLAPAIATLIVFVGSDVTRVVTNAEPSPTGITAAAEELAAASAFSGSTFGTTLVVAGAAGLAGAIVAIRFHTHIIGVAVTGLGAVFIGIVAPLWEQALTGTVQFGGGADRASRIAILAALVLGLAFQAVRNLDSNDLPGSSGRSLE